MGEALITRRGGGTVNYRKYTIKKSDVGSVKNHKVCELQKNCIIYYCVVNTSSNPDDYYPYVSEYKNGILSDIFGHSSNSASSLFSVEDGWLIIKDTSTLNPTNFQIVIIE